MHRDVNKNASILTLLWWNPDTSRLRRRSWHTEKPSSWSPLTQVELCSFTLFGMRTSESVGLALLFYSTNSFLLSKRFFTVRLPTVIKAELTTIGAASGAELKRRFIHQLYNVTLLKGRKQWPLEPSSSHFHPPAVFLACVSQAVETRARLCSPLHVDEHWNQWN